MANWRNTIKIKHLFTNEDASEEQIKFLSKSLYKQLLFVVKRERKLIDKKSKQAMSENYAEDDIEELELIADNFKNIVESEECDEYCNDYQEWFNAILENLYDHGDSKVWDETGKEQKFLWIG